MRRSIIRRRFRCTSRSVLLPAGSSQLCSGDPDREGRYEAAEGSHIAAPPRGLPLLARGIGITVRADTDPKRHEAWGRLILHLCGYFIRTTRRNLTSVDECCAMVGRLLNLATGGICPDDRIWVRRRYHDAVTAASKRDAAADTD